MEGEAVMNEVAAVVRDGKRFLLLTHRGPDGDGLGSMVGCAEVLRGLGKQAVMLLPDGAPENLRYLTGVREAVQKIDPKDRFDAAFVFDCGDPRLLQGSLPPHEKTGTVVVFDHHAVAVPFGDLCWRDPAAAATGILVYTLARHLGAAIGKSAAEALYVAIVADTGGFRYSNTRAEVLRIAADLIDRGADPFRISQATFDSQPAARLALLRRVLETLKITIGGRFATLEVTDEMIKEAGAHAEMVEGFVNYARSIRDIEVGALLSKKGSSLRASLRGRGSVDVAKVAATFGGGGHHDAAGCEITAPDLVEARVKLEQAIEKEMGG